MCGVELDLRQVYMRGPTLDGPAALVYCPLGGLLYNLLTSADHRTFERVAALRRCRRAVPFGLRK